MRFYNYFLKLLFCFGISTNISTYAKNDIIDNSDKDSIPIIIKGVKYFLMNHDDNNTPYYYLFVTSDRNEVYDIRTKKILWTRPLEERKYRPIWKKLPEKRKYKEIIKGKTYYKYFKNDSLVVLQKNYHGDSLIRTDYGFYSYDSITETSMCYRVDSDKIYWAKGIWYTRGWDNIPFLNGKLDNWERKPIAERDFEIYNHDIRIVKQKIYDAPEQSIVRINLRHYKQLSKIETTSKDLEHITQSNEDNRINKIVLFYNKAEKMLYIKKIDNTILVDEILLLEKTGKVVQKLKPKEFIDVSDLSKGVYYLTPKTKNKNIVSYRLYLSE